MITYKWFEKGEPYEDSITLRKEVFCDEQKYPFEAEIDELDKVTPHLVGYDDGIAVGTGRVVYVDEKTCHIGRIAVKKEFRGKGYGKLVVNELLRRVKEERIFTVTIEAQTHAQGFYEKLGFKVVSFDVIYDLHIPHYKMICKLGE